MGLFFFQLREKLVDNIVQIVPLTLFSPPLRLLPLPSLLIGEHDWDKQEEQRLRWTGSFTTIDTGRKLLGLRWRCGGRGGRINFLSISWIWGGTLTCLSGALVAVSDRRSLVLAAMSMNNFLFFFVSGSGRPIRKRSGIIVASVSVVKQVDAAAASLRLKRPTICGCLTGRENTSWK